MVLACFTLGGCAATPEVVTAFFAGLNSYTPVLAVALVAVVLQLRSTGATVAKIEATTAKTAAINADQDVKLKEVINLANGRLEQLLLINAQQATELARLNGSLEARHTAAEARRAHDEHKAHADAAREASVAEIAATEAQTAAISAAVAAKVDVPQPSIPGQVT